MAYQQTRTNERNNLPTNSTKKYGTHKLVTQKFLLIEYQGYLYQDHTAIKPDACTTWRTNNHVSSNAITYPRILKSSKKYGTHKIIINVTTQKFLKSVEDTCSRTILEQKAESIIQARALIICPIWTL